LKMATGTRELKVDGQRIGDSRLGGRLDWPRLATVGVALAIVATGANLALALGLRSLLTIPVRFEPLGVTSVASFTIIGMFAATVVFAWTVAVRKEPVRKFVGMAIAALFISWLPDLFILVTGVFPGTTVSGVVGLMSLHLVPATCAVVLLARFGLAERS
jgi:Family of unknown function (DUF6069)